MSATLAHKNTSDLDDLIEKVDNCGTTCKFPCCGCEVVRVYEGLALHSKLSAGQGEIDCENGGENTICWGCYGIVEHRCVCPAETIRFCECPVIQSCGMEENHDSY